MNRLTSHKTKWELFDMNLQAAFDRIEELKGNVNSASTEIRLIEESSEQLKLGQIREIQRLENSYFEEFGKFEALMRAEHEQSLNMIKDTIIRTHKESLAVHEAEIILPELAKFERNLIKTLSKRCGDELEARESELNSEYVAKIARILPDEEVKFRAQLDEMGKKHEIAMNKLNSDSEE